jgi:hypothetical protein
MSKKPAKKPSSSATPPAPKIDTGINVMYIGYKGVKHTCPHCGSSRGKGMVREYKSVLYCGIGCVLSYKRINEVQQ